MGDDAMKPHEIDEAVNRVKDKTLDLKARANALDDLRKGTGKTSEDVSADVESELADLKAELTDDQPT